MESMRTILTPKPAGRAGVLLTVGLLPVVTSGCRTFSYTEEDLQRESLFLEANLANVPRGGWGCGGGITIRPDLGNLNLGNIGFPNLGGGVCPGK